MAYNTSSTTRDDGTGTASPLDIVIERAVIADAITADSDSVIGVAHIKSVKGTATITAVEYTPNAAKAGADTDTRTLTIKNKGGAGAGALAPASFAMTAGKDLAAFVPKSLTLGAAAQLVVTDGDVLELNSAHAGNGLTQPGGLLRIHMVMDVD